MKTYYLIKYWTLHRGETRDNPGGYYGPGFCGRSLPDRINSDACYSSLKRAERVSARRYSVYTPNEVIEVPAGIVREYKKDKVSGYHVPVKESSDTVTVILDGVSTSWVRIDAIRHFSALLDQAFQDRNDTLKNKCFVIIANLLHCFMVCPDTEQLS